jgi:hypothetical protein
MGGLGGLRGMGRLVGRLWDEWECEPHRRLWDRWDEWDGWDRWDRWEGWDRWDEWDFLGASYSVRIVFL